MNIKRYLECRLDDEDEFDAKDFFSLPYNCLRTACQMPCNIELPCDHTSFPSANTA